MGPERTLIFGDCLDELRRMEDGVFDAVVTSPPFVSTGGGNHNGRSAHGDAQFFQFWLKAVVSELRRVVKPAGCGFIHCDWRTLREVEDAFAPPGNAQRDRNTWRMSQALAWDRDGNGMGSPFRNAFEMFGFVRGPDFQSALPKNIPNLIRYRWPYGVKRAVGSQLPVGLLTTVCGWAANGKERVRILDPFCGSGSTLTAAAGLGHDSVGIEVDPDVYGIALQEVGILDADRRWQAHQAGAETSGEDGQ